jgi:hypothetical protein
MTINEQEKELIVQSTVDSADKMMEKIITRQSPKKRVLSFCKPHEQSKTAITLTETQRLPARPRDFRISLEGQIDMLRSELSDILALSVRNYLFEPKRNNSHFSRGRLRSDVEASDMVRDRGALSYYTWPQIRKIIYEILSDSKGESIDNAILNSEIFYRFVKYCYEVYLYQMKENEQAFLNATSPAIRKYGLRHKNTKESDNLDIYARDLTPDKIDKLAKANIQLLQSTKLKRIQKNILYTA